MPSGHTRVVVAHEHGSGGWCSGIHSKPCRVAGGARRTRRGSAVCRAGYDAGGDEYAGRRAGWRIDVTDHYSSSSLLLPWWVDLGIAVGGFFACRAVRDSTRTLPVPTGIGDSSALTRTVRQSVVLSFATIGMWVIPIAFVVGAVLSFSQRRQKRPVHSVSSLEDFGPGVLGVDSMGRRNTMTKRGVRWVGQLVG